MKKITSVLLVLLLIIGTFSGCGKEEKEKTMSELLIGDWYTYSGSPYRSFSENGTVTGTDYYTSSYSVDGDTITWESASGEKVTVSFYTDGEILRIASDIGSYFTARRYYYRSAEGVAPGTGFPEKGTSDDGIFGSWYNEGELFFTLSEGGVLSGCRDLDSFSFDGSELVLFSEGAASDEAAKCTLSEDTLIVFYTDELTGEKAELVLTKGN